MSEENELASRLWQTSSSATRGELAIMNKERQKVEG